MKANEHHPLTMFLALVTAACGVGTETVSDGGTGFGGNSDGGSRKHGGPTDGAVQDAMSEALLESDSASSGQDVASGSHTLFSLVVAGGNHQLGLPNTSLPNALVVRAVDFHQVPVVGLPVTFTVSSGSGTLTLVSVVTGAKGYASTALKLGSTSGMTTVTATANVATAVFTETSASSVAKANVSLDGATQGAMIHAQFGTNFMGNFLDAVQVPMAPPERAGSIPGLTRLDDWPNAVIRIHANPALNGSAVNASLPLPYATATAAAWDFSFLNQQILDIQSIQSNQDILLCIAYAPYDAADPANTGLVGAGTPLVTFPRPSASSGYGYLSGLAGVDAGSPQAYTGYAAYIENLVRYYNASGFTDSYGIHVRPNGMKPIKYWSLANEPNWSGSSAEWNNVGYPPSFSSPYPPQFTPDQFVTLWNATVPGMKSIASQAGNPILMVGPETADSFPNWFQYVEAVLNLPVTKLAGTALYQPVPAEVTVLPDVISIHDYGASADDGINGGATDVQTFAAIAGTFVSHTEEVNGYLAKAQVTLPLWFGEVGMMQHNATSSRGDVAWGRTWTGMSAAWYGWTFDQIAENGVSALAEFAFASKWKANDGSTPDGDDQRSMLDNMDSDQTTPVLRYWTLYMLDRFFPSGSTILTTTVTSPASPPNGVIHAFAATPGSDSARVAVVNMPDPSGSSTIKGGTGSPENVTVHYTFTSVEDALAAATTMAPVAFFFDNTLFTGTQLTSSGGVPQITFAPFDPTNPPTNNGVPNCPAASLLTPTISGSTVTVTVTSPGYGLILIDFPTAVAPAITPPSIALDATSGDGQTSVVGSPLAAPFIATVRDSRGTVVAGVPVTFEVLSGTGSLSATSAVTDASGQVSTTLTIGASGSIRVQASAVDLAPIEFGAKGK